MFWCSLFSKVTYTYELPQVKEHTEGRVLKCVFPSSSCDGCKASDDLLIHPLLITKGHTVLQCLLGLWIQFVGAKQKTFPSKKVPAFWSVFLTLLSPVETTGLVRNSFGYGLILLPNNAILYSTLSYCFLFSPRNLYKKTLEGEWVWKGPSNKTNKTTTRTWKPRKESLSLEEMTVNVFETLWRSGPSLRRSQSSVVKRSYMWTSYKNLERKAR